MYRVTSKFASKSQLMEKNNNNEFRRCSFRYSASQWERPRDRYSVGSKPRWRVEVENKRGGRKARACGQVTCVRATAKDKGTRIYVLIIREWEVWRGRYLYLELLSRILARVNRNPPTPVLRAFFSLSRDSIGGKQTTPFDWLSLQARISMAQVDNIRLKW